MANYEIIGAGQDTAHRAPKINTITCGDCLDVMQCIPDKSVDMVLCDLPYGTTNCAWDIVIPFDNMWKNYKRIIKNNGAIVLFGSEPFSSGLRLSNTKMYKYDFIWDKVSPSGFLNANKMPMKRHEIISVFYKAQPIYNKIYKVRSFGSHSMGNPLNYTKSKGLVEKNIYGKIREKKQKENRSDNLKNPDSILEVSRGNGRGKDNGLHPTQKPVALFEYLIRTYTNEGDTVLDNCIGSGTTAIACINTGRNYIGIEKEEKYCRIAEERIHALRSPAQNTMEICHTAPNSANRQLKLPL